MNEIELKSKPRRAQGGKCLLSRSIHVQSLHKSMAKIPNSREERRGEGQGGGEEGAWAGGARPAAMEKRERGRERGFLTPTTLNPKD